MMEMAEAASSRPIRETTELREPHRGSRTSRASRISTIDGNQAHSRRSEKSKRMEMAVLLQMAHDEVKDMMKIVARSGAGREDVAESINCIIEALRRVHEQHQMLTFFKTATWEAKIIKLINAGLLAARSVEDVLTNLQEEDAAKSELASIRAKMEELGVLKESLTQALTNEDAVRKFRELTMQAQDFEDAALRGRVEDVGELNAAAEIFREEISAVDVESSATNINVWKNVYYGSIRMRNVYFVITSSLMILGILCGLFIQVLFEIYMDNRTYKFVHFLRLTILPLLVVLIALVGDELSDITFDTFTLPTTSWSRSVSAVAMTDAIERFGKRSNKDRWNVLLLQDVLDAFLMDMLMGFAFVFKFAATRHFEKSVHNMMIGGIVWAVITVTRVIVCDMYINYRLFADPQILNKTERMQEAVMHHGIRAGRLRHEIAIIDTYHDNEQKLADTMPECSVQHDLRVFYDRYRAKASEFEREPRNDEARKCLALGLIIWLPVVAVAFVIDVEPPAWLMLLNALLLMFAVYAFSRAFQNKFPNAVGPAFVVILIMLGLISVTLVLSEVALKGQSPGLEHNRTVIAWVEDQTHDINNIHNQLPRRYENMKTTVYPICRMRWGAHVRELGVLDMAILSSYSYTMEEEDFLQQVQYTFNHALGIADVSALNITAYEHYPRWTAVKFVPYLHGNASLGADHASPTIVVTVKGTSTVKDIFADMSLYSIVQVMQLLSNVFPVLSIVPQVTTAWILQILRFGDIASEEERTFHELEVAVKQIHREHPGATLLLTGHSLGGGLAGAVGARLGLPAVVFSAPGMSLSHKRFAVNEHSTLRNVVGIRPTSDPVPGVDLHMDMVQNIDCRDKQDDPRFFMDCHSISITTCELWRACGDFRRRDFSDFCGEYVSAEQMGKYFPDTHGPSADAPDPFLNPERADDLYAEVLV